MSNQINFVSNMLKNAAALQLPEDNSDREKNMLGQLLPALLGGASGATTAGAIQLPIALHEISSAFSRMPSLFPDIRKTPRPPTPKGLLMAGLLASLGAGGYVGKKVYDAVDAPANELPEFMLKSKNAYSNPGGGMYPSSPMYPSSGVYRPEDNKAPTPAPYAGKDQEYSGSGGDFETPPTYTVGGVNLGPPGSMPKLELPTTVEPPVAPRPPVAPIPPVAPRPPAAVKPPAGRYPNVRSGAPKSEFETYHGTSFNPKSTEDRAKMDALNKSRAAGPAEMRRTANAFPLHKRASAYPGF